MTSTTQPLDPSTSAPLRHPEREGLTEEQRWQGKRDRKRARAKRARLRSFFLKPAIAVAGLLPLRVAGALGEFVGLMAYLLVGKYRRRVLEHLELAFGDEYDERARRALGRRNFRFMGRSIMSFFAYHRLGTERALAHVRAEGEEHLHAALAEGHGVLLVGAHYGLVELAACWCAARHGASVVGRRESGTNPLRLLYTMREELGCPTIRRGDPRQILRCLHANKPVGILVDHAIADVQGVFLPFFGRLAMTVTGPAVIAHRTASPLVPMFIEWDGPTTHRVIVQPALHLRTDLPRHEAIVDLTARLNSVVEAQIRRLPEQWFWLHKRWDENPEDFPEHPVYDRPRH